MSYHSAKFGGHRHSCSGEKMILVCHVISKDRLIKGSYDFMGGSPSSKVTTLPNLMAIGIVVMEICF